MSNTARNFYFPSDDAPTATELRAERIADREAAILADDELCSETIRDAAIFVYHDGFTFCQEPVPANHSAKPLIDALKADDAILVCQLLKASWLESITERAEADVEQAEDELA